MFENSINKKSDAKKKFFKIIVIVTKQIRCMEIFILVTPTQEFYILC